MILPTFKISQAVSRKQNDLEKNGYSSPATVIKLSNKVLGSKKIPPSDLNSTHHFKTGQEIVKQFRLASLSGNS